MIKKNIVEILSNIRSDIDYTECNEIITGEYFRSFDIISMIAEIEGEFNIEIEPEEMIADNFDSIEAITKYIEFKLESSRG